MTMHLYSHSRPRDSAKISAKSLIFGLRRCICTPIALTLAVLLTTLPARAGVTHGTIQEILIVSGLNLIYVYPTGGLYNEAACGGSNNYYSFSGSRPLANAYIAGLLAAEAMGTSVTFWGTGTCADQGTSETLDYFGVIPP